MSQSTLRTLTEVLLNATNRLDINKLTQLTTEDYTRIIVDPDGKPVMLNGQTAWTQYLHRTFAKLKDAAEKLDWEILAYDEEVGEHLASSVMKYRQATILSGQPIIQVYWITTLWRKTAEGWKNAQWHASRLEQRIV